MATARDREGQRAREAGPSLALANRRPDLQLGPGRALESGTQQRMERALGHRFADVRIHDDEAGARASSQLNADAFASGAHVGFASGRYRPGTMGGDALLAHELAHVASSRGARPTGEVARDGKDERAADGVALHAVAALHGRGGAAGAAPGAQRSSVGAVRLARCGGAPQLSAEAQQALAGTRPWTQALADHALGVYAQLGGSERQAFVDQWGTSGRLEPMLRALSTGDVRFGGRHVDALRDLLQRMQRQAAFEQATRAGLAGRAGMVGAQRDFMVARNRAEAERLRPPASPPPTTEQVAAQHERQVERTTVSAQTGTMSAAREAMLTRDAEAAVATFVSWVNQVHPELQISAASFRVAIREVFNRGARVVAFADSPGRGGCGGGSGTPRCVVGETFATAVRANPAYALPVVVHELFGHNEYGEYGARGSELNLEIYDDAAGAMPGYRRPAQGSPARLREIDAYAYQETEIYSLMRQLEYFTPVAPAHSGLDTGNFDPASTIVARVGLIVQQYEPRVAESLLRGMYVRFRADPRLVAKALAAFELGVRTHLPARAGDVLR